MDPRFNEILWQLDRLSGASGERSQHKGYIIDQKEISFNGQGDSPEDEKNQDNSPYWGLACGTFMLRKVRPRKQEWQTEKTWGMDFCKTNRKPYDLIVCSVLLMARAIAPEKFEYEKDTESYPSAKKLLWSILTKFPEKMQTLLVCDTFRP